MRRIVSVVTVTAVIALLACPLLAAAEAKPKPKPKPKPKLAGRWAVVARVTKLEGEQLVQFTDKAFAYQQAVGAWRKLKGAQYKAAAKAVREAKKSGDAEAVKAATAELKTLQGEIRKINQDGQAVAMGALTDEQKQTWKVYAWCSPAIH